MSLLPSSGFIAPAVFAFIFYGLRFLIFASLAFYFSDASRAQSHGRVVIERPSRFVLKTHLRRELRQSGLTLLIFSLVNGLIYCYGLIDHSLIYKEFDTFPVWWFWLSIPVMIFIHDTFFYWLHRAMHTRLLFTKMHRQHHASVYPTAFASYSFGLGEALGEALIVTALIFIVPIHPIAFLIFQTISTAYNVYGHCGKEFYPASVSDHWAGRWLNTASLHAYHHRHSDGNYSFYFTFWDRLMGTLAPVVETTAAKTATRSGSMQ